MKLLAKRDTWEGSIEVWGEGDRLTIKFQDIEFHLFRAQYKLAIYFGIKLPEIPEE